jgi:hypothetical protein
VEPKLQAVTLLLGGEPGENGILELPKYAGTWTQERRNSSSFILIDMSYYGNCLPTKGILNIESLSYVDINFGSACIVAPQTIRHSARNERQ